MPELPTGTVTFLFTDLEGSTRLWEEHPEAMKAALARHDEILRDAVESRDGHVVKTTGDGLHAAFATAVEALAAAVDAQRALGAEAWPDTVDLRARMGLHTGAGEERDGDYYGPAVNRGARIASAAHGGQIVVSNASADLVREDLPDGAALFDLGEHRLRDLGRPERVFQLTAPQLRDTFPPLRSLDAYPGNLPLQVTSFVGRDEDVKALSQALGESRLVTLTGAGGMGKTRLATQLAADLIPKFPDGAWLCELASSGDADAMAQAVAGALGVQERPGMTLVESITDFLRPKQILLVMDNCEHVLDAAAHLVASVLRSCSRVHIVATSRIPLDIAGEQQWPVRPLSVPDTTSPPDDLEACAAGRLFLERAHAVRPDFAIDASNAAAIAEICRRLDGMPLALELAAARVSALGPVEIAALLDERFRLLTGGHRERRHHTLEAAIDWSFSLLGPTEQQVFARLGVFASSFDADAARAVAGGEGIEPFDVIDALAHLVEQSMVTAEPVPDGTMRYELLETLRAYALERLGDEMLRWCRRHAEHYAKVAAEAGAGLATDQEVLWRARLELDIDNMRAAVVRGVEAADDSAAEVAARIVADLAWLVITRPRWRMGDLANRVIARGAFPDSATRCAVFGAASQSAVGWGDYRRALELAGEALRDGLPSGMAAPHVPVSALGTATAVSVGFEESIRAFEDGLKALDEVGAGAGHRIMCEAAAGMVEAAYGCTDAAHLRAQRLMPIARATGNPSALVGTLVALGWSLLETDPDAALTALDEAIDLGRTAATNIGSRGIALSMAAQLRCRLGDPRTAIGALRETVLINADAGDRGMLITAIERSVGVLVDIAQVETAVVLGGAVTGPFARVGHLPATEREAFAAALTRVRDQLGDHAYQRLITRGAAMSLDELVMYTRAELDRALEDLGDA